MIHTPLKSWCRLALCGVLDALCSAIYFTQITGCREAQPSVNLSARMRPEWLARIGTLARYLLAV